MSSSSGSSTASLARWDDPLGRFALQFLVAAEQLFKLLRQPGLSDRSPRAELVAQRLEQQVLTGHRIRKIIERYTKPARGMGLQETLVGDVSWCACASQIKAGLGGWLQQTRLDILCAASVLLAQRPETAEQLVADTALALQTMPCEVYRLINEVARPLLDKAEASVNAATDVSALAQRVAGMSTGAATPPPPAGNASSSSSVVSGSRRLNADGASSSGLTSSQQQQQLQLQPALALVTLSASCPEYADAMRESADPVIAALSLCTRGNERLHGVHLEILRGLLAGAVLGIVRRHSLLVSAVKSLRDASHKYHRIVQGMEAIRVIRESVLVAMGAGDAVPEPAGKLVEVDAVGRLLQETMATCNVVRELCGLLKQWIVPAEQLAHSPQRHAFDHPSAQKTAVATAHMKSNGQYLLQTLRNLSSLLRRVSGAADKCVTQWSEPALGSFSRILEIHSAPLLQCARVMANAQTDLKALSPLVREKAQLVEEARDIEDTLAVVHSTVGTSSGGGGGGGGGAGGGGAGSSATSAGHVELIYSSFESRIRSCEALARTIFGIAAKSTSVLQEVVATTCRPIAAGSSQLPCQYIDSETSLLEQSMAQLCAQHDSIIANLSATTSAAAAGYAAPGSGAAAGRPPVMTLEEVTSISAQRMTEAEQRAIASSCSFERLEQMLAHSDAACDKWFAANGSRRDPLQVAMKGESAAATTAATGDDGSARRKRQPSPGLGPSSNRSGSRDAQLDEEQLATVAPEALLPASVRNEDRKHTMQVVRGTLKHLEEGQRVILSVPRPDRVASPAALNDYEDSFSIAFVGVEGLCEQSLIAGTANPMFTMPSASSLDILARIGAAASPSHAAASAAALGNRRGGTTATVTIQGGGGGGNRSPSESSAGMGESHASRSLYGGNPSGSNAPTPQHQQGRNMRARADTHIGQTLAATHAARAAISSPAAMVLGVGAGTGALQYNTSSSRELMSARQTMTNDQMVAAAAQSAGVSPGLKMRSFTSVAAKNLPEHLMVPPGHGVAIY